MNSLLTVATNTPPGLRLEREAWADGAQVVVGIDEVGKGAWAGPLTLAAVVLPRDRRVNNVRDSKLLTERRREALYDRLTSWCEAWSVGHASEAECDELGMSDAQRLAACRALEGLGVTPDHVIVDGTWDFVGGGISRTQVKADRVSLSVATASIIAKVTRDRLMRAVADEFPAFAFDQNKGYPCPRHKLALHGYGPTAIHRRSWSFMDGLAWRGAVRSQSAVMLARAEAEAEAGRSRAHRAATRASQVSLF